MVSGFIIYAAPDNAVDYDGPCEIGMVQSVETVFGSEAECRTQAIQTIGRLCEGMLAPIRFRCVAVEERLPKGAPR